MSFEDIIIGHADRIDWTEKFKEHFRKMPEEEQSTLIEAIHKALRPTHNCPLCGFSMHYQRGYDEYSRKIAWLCVNEDCGVETVIVYMRESDGQ